MTHSVATAADYAEAMFTARAARNWLVGLLALMLLSQLGLFFAAKYSTLFGPGNAAVASSSEPAPSTMPNPLSEATTQPVKVEPASRRITLNMLHYLVGAIGFLGMVFSMVLTIVLLLILIIMLVGRLIGVSHVTSAFVWALILALLLFPWQAFLNNADLTAQEFKIPGVFYTWGELIKYKDFASSDWSVAALRWSRFVVFPVVALVLLLVVQSKSSRGLRLALGEEHVVEVGAAPV